MAERGARGLGRASVRVRTTLAAVLVVAIALLVGGIALVVLVRGALVDGLESSAEQRADTLAAQVRSTETPAARSDSSGGDEGRDGDEVDEDLEDEVWQVLDGEGRVVSSSQPLARPLPARDADAVRLPGGEAPYLVVTESAGDYRVVVAVSREEVEDSVAALVPLLLVGLPALLLLVGGTTWIVVTRALRPVERIRSEVEQITGDRLDRRVPEPASRDEVHRLARTMNGMLGRLQDAQERQRQFVGDASHELRSPLAGIRQTAEVARAHPGAMPEGELADAVLEESLRMQRLVEQLLLLTRADEGAVAAQRREVDLDDLVLTEARRVRRTGLDVDGSGIATARVRGDETALAQVVRNLVDNAARHATSRIGLGVHEDDGRAVVVVDDDGAGIAPADRERVFERFVRLDESRARDAGGSGLGLAIVREIVRAHGGSVEIGSSPWGGARVTVRLPGAVG
ncbi:ATP-binding protein [Nocardioides aurantiacus]|uniref:ATP-binding protein n=1 Tax=Nocardioides aurantiacus TaxID=86796 RepID=UPI00403FA0A3